MANLNSECEPSEVEIQIKMNLSISILMPRRSGLPSEASILFLRSVESLLVVGFATGVNVVQLILQDPYASLSAMWGEVYKAGNVILVIFCILFLYFTDLDKPILKRLKLFYEGI